MTHQLLCALDRGIGARLHFARGGIEAAQAALLIISEIDDVIFGDGDTAWPSSLSRQLDLGDLHGLGIDLRQFVCAKFTEHRNAFARNHHSIGRRICGRHALQIDLSCTRIEPAYKIAALGREPKHSLLVKNGCMRIASAGIRHLVLGHISRARVELANEPGIVSRVPHISVAIECQAVRPRIWRLQRIFAHHARCGIKPPQSVALLAGPPQ